MAPGRMACARHFGCNEEHNFPDRSCFEITTLPTTMCIAAILLNNISYIHEAHSGLKLNQISSSIKHDVDRHFSFSLWSYKHLSVMKVEKPGSM
jgi:hypothetical protein